MLSKKLGTREVEEFLIAERNKGGEKYYSKIQKYKEERAIVESIMKTKKKEMMKKCIYLRKCRDEAKLILKMSLGGETRKFQRIVKEVRKNCSNIKDKLKKKNARKVRFLMKKYEVKTNILEEMTPEEISEYGEAEIFNPLCKMRGQELREPEVVNEVGLEEIKLSNEEKKFLALGPKFCMRKKLNEEAFEVAIEECITKMK